MPGRLSYGAVTGSTLIPAEVQKFVRECLHSVEQLEILLLLELQSARSWTAQQVSAELRSDANSAENKLSSLYRSGLLATGPGFPTTYSFAPHNPALGELVTKTRDAYRVYRVRMIELICQRPTDAARHFANSFRLKREDS